LPLLFAIVTYLLFSGLKLINPSYFKENYLRNCMTTNFVFLFLIYPIITSSAFGMFNCMEIEGVSYLIRDFSIECWSATHI
jgi:hypothetical protein